MWFWCWPHSVYHVVRWLPKDNRFKIGLVAMIFTLAFLIPEGYVLSRDSSTRDCQQHLFELLIVTIVFTFVMIGFSFIFSIMDPVPYEIKVAFHVFGFLSFLVGTVTIAFTFLAKQCEVTTPALYYLMLSFSVLSLISIAFIVLMLPFWIINYRWTDSVYDRRNRLGICYEPVDCCTCLWHV